MRFALMRHATAAPPRGMRDEDRPLTPDGVQEAVHGAQWLAQHGLLPMRIVASPAWRTQQTAQTVASHLGLAVATDPRIYEASTATVLDFLGQGDILLVGHNPALEEAVQHLLPPRDVPWQRMAPASIVVLTGDLRRAGCRLEASWRPLG